MNQLTNTHENSQTVSLARCHAVVSCTAKKEIYSIDTESHKNRSTQFPPWTTTNGLTDEPQNTISSQQQQIVRQNNNICIETKYLQIHGILRHVGWQSVHSCFQKPLDQIRLTNVPGILAKS